MEKLREQLPSIWQHCTPSFYRWSYKWDFQIFPVYKVRLTLYGMGGDYYPSYSAFDGQPRPQPGLTISTKDKAILLVRIKKDTTAGGQKLEYYPIHEAIHLGVEELIRQFGLTRWEKERVVDKICSLEFARTMPKYWLNPKGDTRIDEFLATKRAILRLPEVLEAYIKKYPR